MLPKILRELPSISEPIVEENEDSNLCSEDIWPERSFDTQDLQNVLGSQRPTIEKEFDTISKDLLIPIATLRKLFKSVCEDKICFSKVIQLMT